jgi:MoaA/NifB/PqqE/SkfB family radical SAM enzyme
VSANPSDGKRRAPRVAFVELTRRCNLRCLMCRPVHTPDESAEMTSEMLERVLDEVTPGVDFVDLRGWGESLLVRGFPKLVEELERRKISVRLITNLSVNRPDALDALAHAGAWIGISLDTADADKLFLLRGGAKLALIEANIGRLREAYRYHNQPFERVYLNTTVGPQNSADICGVVSFAIRCGVSEVRLFPEMKDNDLAIREPELCCRVMENLRAAGALADESDVLLTVGARLCTSMQPAVPFHFSCDHPWTHTTIGADGQVGFCDFLLFPGNDHHQVGSLRQQSFEQIWDGTGFSAVRQAHSTRDWSLTPAVSACQWCFSNRYVDFERDLDPKYKEAVMHWWKFYPDLAAGRTCL